MLRAGEYSPNNPLIRSERTTGDVFLGLGEYERRRNTLRKLRQQQYREYLDEQAKKKREAKEQAEKERREREEKERLREERERERLQLERERRSPERRSSLNLSTSVGYSTNKVDTGVQVNGTAKPLSVAVQTDDPEIFRFSPLLLKCGITQAERELSPRTVAGGEFLAHRWDTGQSRRRSYGDYNDTSTLKRSNREKLVSDLRHTYMPSIFDADAIRLRNLQTEKEAAERRQFYQQELKDQIMEQQRIKEERKSREKLLEQAEMRRLEEQLRMLQMSQDREIVRQHKITTQMRESSTEYESKRTELQKEIDFENQRLLRAKSQPLRRNSGNDITSKSDLVQNISNSKLPFYFTHVLENTKNRNSDSIHNGLFSPSYDVDKYLRQNLNFPLNKTDLNRNYDNLKNDNKRFDRNNDNNEEINVKNNDTDPFPIPILRHSPSREIGATNNPNDSKGVVDKKNKERIDYSKAFQVLDNYEPSEVSPNIDDNIRVTKQKIDNINEINIRRIENENIEGHFNQEFKRPNLRSNNNFSDITKTDKKKKVETIKKDKPVDGGLNEKHGYTNENIKINSREKNRIESTEFDRMKKYRDGAMKIDSKANHANGNNAKGIRENGIFNTNGAMNDRIGRNRVNNGSKTEIDKEINKVIERRENGISNTHSATNDRIGRNRVDNWSKTEIDEKEINQVIERKENGTSNTHSATNDRIGRNRVDNGSKTEIDTKEINQVIERRENEISYTNGAMNFDRERETIDDGNEIARKENRMNMSESMKKVDDKWKVPAVQKNILKSIPNDNGKNLNILTQLGSIRRQLQLEQLKLDNLVPKDM